MPIRLSPDRFSFLPSSRHSSWISSEDCESSFRGWIFRLHCVTLSPCEVSLYVVGAPLAMADLMDTVHKEEVPPATVEKHYNLFNVVDALNSRGKDDYAEKLNKIPVEYHHRLNYILQCMAQSDGYKIHEKNGYGMALHCQDHRP